MYGNTRMGKLILFSIIAENNCINPQYTVFIFQR